MDTVLLVKAAIMGVVEGLTEFLPISSTGHLILAGSLLGFDDDRAKVFDIAIQTGAILAVVLVYWQKLQSTFTTLPSSAKSRRLVLNVLIGFLPAVVLGLLLGKVIKAHLFTPVVVATTFIVGGFIILWAERRQHVERFALEKSSDPNILEARRTSTTAVRVQSVDDMTPLDALKVGLAQCLALVPGTSRSGATIIGGMLMGLSRQAATDFSFFLAIPTLIGAGAYSLYKERALLSASDAPMFIVGLVFSFISAWICVRWLLRYIATHSFTAFAWYRIVFGIVVLATAWSGLVTWAE
ncbi:undecaprenyl-diphosphate phosphatase [Xylophilus rhododendri]|uniref:Undecaprenyl-diphosphatase n=1 Tax=Xylophilus rhododendri TaxID=2697032 RepID=A0A857JD28_9BURK|nr:undecaprenyl-diphosphate phosphatase [Xylophilus rhododendri]QHJ01114.1 undecaprenyl-diphosphate phosphatase [Xylophilus rhododendri]